jgi:hypothetical protein
MVPEVIRIRQLDSAFSFIFSSPPSLNAHICFEPHLQIIGCSSA